jgi:hypothetical protein
MFPRMVAEVITYTLKSAQGQNTWELGSTVTMLTVEP